MSVSARLELRVEWGDCDPAEIVFYPNYFRWFDAAAHNLFKQVGGGWAELFKRHGVVGVPLVDAQARFTRPTRFGDELVIESRVAVWERKVFKLEHAVFNDGQLAVEGQETRAWCIKHPDDPKHLRAQPIPEQVIALFGGEA